MELLKDYIRQYGVVREGNILKVDSFLNHQLDPSIYQAIAKEIYRLYKDEDITKIVTIEASGIAAAIMVAQYFQVPAIFAKKTRSANLDGELYRTQVYSFTHGLEYEVTLSKRFLNKEDKVLLIDDFLADGMAMRGLIDICNQANAEVKGIAVCIEKGFQKGGQYLREQGIRLESLAIIEEMNEDGSITFR